MNASSAPIDAAATGPAAAPEARGASRLFYLDALRCFCMLFGIFVHGASIGDTPFFDVIKTSSDYFRMATFFVISGYFTALVARRSTAPVYLRSRRDVLLVPFLATLLLLNPVTNWLIHNVHNPWMDWRTYFLEGGWALPKRGLGVWHLHLWFLVSLMVYAALTPLLIRLFGGVTGTRLVDRYVTLTGRFTIWANVLLVALGSVVMQTLYDRALQPLVGGTVLDWCTRATLYYSSFFLLGLVAFLNRRLFAAMHRFSWAGLILFGVGQYLAIGWRDAQPSALASIAFWVTRAGLTTFLIAGLLALFQRFANRPSPVVAFLVDSAYSFYLFHLLVVYAIATLMLRITADLHLVFAVIVLAGIPLLLAWHGLVVRRVPLLRFLFNGKRRRPAASPAAPASA